MATPTSRTHGNAFRLLDLPIELRAYIFRHVLGGHIYPQVGRNKLQARRRVFFGCKDGVDIDPWRFAIFEVCKTVREEALSAGWVGTVKHFQSTAALKKVLTCPNPPANIAWLTKIRLEDSITSYFYFLDIQVYSCIKLYSSNGSSGHLFQSIPTLQEFILHFNNPYEHMDENPWYDLYYPPWEIPRKDPPPFYPCHKVAVDLVLMYFFPFIKHIPKVRLVGCIKTSVKHKWDEILAKEYAEREMDCRTHNFNWEEEMRAMEARPVNTPVPLCVCTKSCYFDLATDPDPDERLDYND